MTITRVQGNARNQGNGTSISVTLATTPTAGNVLIAVVSTDSDSTAVTVTGITTTNVSWTKQNSKTEGAINVEIWLGVVSASAGTSVVASFTGSASDLAVINVCEYSGLAANPLDKTAVANDNSDTTSTGTTDTTTQNEELWIGGIHHIYWGANQTDPTNGFTLLDGSYLDWWSGSQAYLEKIVSSRGTANSGTSVTGKAYLWVGCIATFKGASSTLSVSDSGNGAETLKNVLSLNDVGDMVESINSVASLSNSEVAVGNESLVSSASNGGNSRRSRARRERRDLLLKQKRTQQPMTLILKQEQASYPTGSTNEILQKTEELINIKKLREKK